MRTLTFYLRELGTEEINALRAELNEIGGSLGFYAQAGRTAGEPVFSPVLAELAKGKAAIIQVPGDPGPAIRHLESLKEDWADTIATALRAALARQGEAE